MISKDWFREPMSAVEGQLAARNIEDVHTHYYMTEHLGAWDTLLLQNIK